MLLVVFGVLLGLSVACEDAGGWSDEHGLVQGKTYVCYTPEELDEMDLLPDWDDRMKTKEAKFGRKYMSFFMRQNLAEIEKLFISYELFKKRYEKANLNKDRLKDLYQQRKQIFMLQTKQLLSCDFYQWYPHVSGVELVEEGSRMAVNITYGMNTTIELCLVFPVNKVNGKYYFTGGVEVVGYL